MTTKIILIFKVEKLAVIKASHTHVYFFRQYSFMWCMRDKMAPVIRAKLDLSSGDTRVDEGNGMIVVQWGCLNQGRY